MHPLLSMTARILGLPDPLPTWCRTRAVRPDQIDAIAGGLEASAAQAATAADGMASAAQTVRRTWSAPEPGIAITGLGAAASGVADSCLALVAAARRTADELRAACADADAVTADADREAASWESDPWMLDPLSASGATSLRTGVIMGLHQALWAAIARQDAAAVALAAALGSDPRQVVADAAAGSTIGIGTPPGGMAAATDAANRDRLSADLGLGRPGPPCLRGGRCRVDQLGSGRRAGLAARVRP